MKTGAGSFMHLFTHTVDSGSEEGGGVTWIYLYRDVCVEGLLKENSSRGGPF